MAAQRMVALPTVAWPVVAWHTVAYAHARPGSGDLAHGRPTFHEHELDDGSTP